MKISICLTVALALIQTSINAQLVESPRDIMPAQAGHEALPKDVMAQVSHYTGSIAMSVPLHTVSVGDISIPISLSYQYHGFKNSEYASNIGLGWNLGNPGVITRVVRGEDDFAPYQTSFTSGGYHNHNIDGFWIPFAFDNNCIDNQSSNAYNSPTFLSQFYKYSGYENYKTDAQPDIFYFNFLGESLRFMIDQDKSVVILSESEYQISVDFNTKVFTVLTDQGYKLTFDQLASMYTHTVTTSETHKQDLTVDTKVDNKTRNYISSWYLTKIESPQGYSVDLEYEITGTVISNTLPIDEYKSIPQSSPPPCNCPLQVNRTTLSYQTPECLIFKSIKYNQTDLATFHYLPRCDMQQGRLMNEVRFYNLDGHMIKKFGFKQSYDPSDPNAGYMLSPFGGCCCIYPPGKIDQDYRLWLHELEMYDKEGLLFGNFKFEYEGGAVPKISSKSIDYWGFYNGAANTSLLLNTVGVNREPDLNFAKLGALKRAIIPSGGIREFEYELNDYKDGGQNMLGGGIRVKEVRSKLDINTTASVVKYEYTDFSFGNQSSSGQLMSPLIKFVVAEESSLGPFCGANVHLNMYCPGYIIKTSSSMAPQYNSAKGSSIGYSIVSEVFGANGEFGKKVYFFKNEADITRQYKRYNLNNTLSNEYGVYGSSIAFTETNGLLEKVEVYENNFGNLVLKSVQENQYQCVALAPNVRSLAIYGRFLNHPPADCSLLQKIVENNNKYRVRLLVSYSKVYTDNSPTPYTSFTEYSYNFLSGYHYPNAISQYSNFSSNSRLITYPMDYHPSAMNGVIGVLLSKNIKAVPINELIFRDTEVIGGKVFEYQATPNLIFPKGEYKLILDNPISNYNHSTFDIFSGYNYKKLFEYGLNWRNIVEVVKPDDMPKSTIWNYHRQLPVAEVLNASYEEIAYTSFETYDNHGWQIDPGGVLDQSQVGLPIPTGKYAYNGSFSLPPTLPEGDYYLTFFSTHDSPPGIHGAQVLQVNTTNIDGLGWNLFEYKIHWGAGEELLIEDGLYDEVRVYPTRARMNTKTYEPFFGVTSTCDENCRTVYFTLDDLGRTIEIKDQNLKMVKRMEYHKKD